MSAPFLAELAKRRSIYALGNKLPISKEKATEIIKDATRISPCSFNAQTSRLIILYGAEHAKLWQLVKDALKAKISDPEALKASEAKIDSCFASGAGTVLFFEDQATVKQQMESYPSYAANFPVWAEHSSAIAQMAVWTALAQENVGASLQHYNELITDAVHKMFDAPEAWRLIAQMPFGSIEKGADKRSFIPDEGRFIVRGA